MKNWLIFGTLLLGLIVLSGPAFIASQDPRANAAPQDPVEPTTGGFGSWHESPLLAPNGKAVVVSDYLGERGTAFVFLSTECPISNGYIPLLNRIAGEYRAKGVELVGVNSNTSQTTTDIETQITEFSVKFPVLKDPESTLARSLRAQVTPEAILLDRDGTVVYRGRIDDRFSKRGGAAKEVQNSELLDAVKELVDGKPISVKPAKAIGCAIEFPRNITNVAPKGTSQVTYCRDIAPVLQKHCQECHRMGGIGPFELASYSDAVQWADDLVEYTSSRKMPPWKATPGYGEFAHPRQMEQDEIDRISMWVKQGCVEGARTDRPTERVFESGWKLGRKPDLVLQVPEFELGGDGPDEYRCYVLPTEFSADKYVTAIEVRPGIDRVVHHVIAFLDTTGRARQLDEKHDGPGYVTSAGFPGFVPNGGLGGWAPGNLTHELPAGIARLLPRGADVVVQVHYHRSGKTEIDRTQIGLYFSQHEVKRCVRNVPVLPLSGPIDELEIPAGAAHYPVDAALVLPMEMDVFGVTPHMHLLGKEMRVRAITPDGTEIPIIEIKDWDFNWQESYPLRQPIRLPKLTRIEMVAHFDNSESNPNNPRKPPTAVRWGESTDEEMCIAFLEMSPADKSQNWMIPPSRGQQLAFFLQSQLLDNQTPAREKMRIIRRFQQRIDEQSK